MSKDIHIADFVVHLHPEASHDDRERLENDLRAHTGVVSVHFDTQEHPHAVVVAYDTDAVTSDALLADIRKSDSQAVMVGF